ncbi:hypothetical protein [Streptomyces sp. NPDC059788]|uniref:hypothetical protein n=1 Tax=Streptomyces sp. NPDC059788 TaxID=3346948 RepID=UPI003667C43B
MTVRPTASTITDAQLDDLYRDRDALRVAVRKLMAAGRRDAAAAPQEALSARETAREGSGGARHARTADRPSERRPAPPVGQRPAETGPGTALGGPQSAARAPEVPDCPEPREKAAGGHTELHALLARLITDAAHHARCAERCRELRRPSDIHDGFAAGFTAAACYTADLIATGALQWRGGHHVPADDEAAAAHLADGLAGTAPERAQQILRAIRGEAA